MRQNVWNELTESDRPLVDMFRNFAMPWTFRPFLSSGRPYVPVTDVFERGADLVVKVELPGIDPAKDLTLTYADGTLAIKGERKSATEVKDDGYYRKESTFGYFERYIPVPETITEGDIKASYENGVLEIVLHGGAKPPAKATPKAIPVGVPKPVKA